MTVPANLNRITYNGNGSTTVFAYTFPILAQGDLDVYLVSSAGVATLRTITTHYTVSGEGELTGGNVTMITAPAVGEQLLIIRNVAITQESEYNDNREIPADTIEENLDKLTMITQQLDEVVGRSLTLPVQTSGVSAELPTPEADAIIGWDAAGTALENKVPADLSSAFNITLSGTDTKKLVRVNTAGNGYELVAGTAYDQIFGMSSKIMKWAKGADVASASSLTLGDDGNFFDITGTTTITSITAKSAGTIVLLQFDGILTVTDGSNLKLAGNFTTAAESTLTLVCDGTNWFEISRNSTTTKPSFHVNRNNSNQTISHATATKVQFNNEVFDTNNNFDSTTNYRFTPTVSGKYLIILSLYHNDNDTTSQEWWARIYKNGTTYAEQSATYRSMLSNSYQTEIVTSIVDMNGSTDYIEGYVYQACTGATSKTLGGYSQGTYMTGCKID